MSVAKLKSRLEMPEGCGVNSRRLRSASTVVEDLGINLRYREGKSAEDAQTTPGSGRLCGIGWIGVTDRAYAADHSTRQPQCEKLFCSIRCSRVPALPRFGSEMLLPEPSAERNLLAPV